MLECRATGTENGVCLRTQIMVTANYALSSSMCYFQIPSVQTCSEISQIYVQGKIKQISLFLCKSNLFGSLHFLHQSALSSFFLLVVLENAILTSLS